MSKKKTTDLIERLGYERSEWVRLERPDAVLAVDVVYAYLARLLGQPLLE